MRLRFWISGWLKEAIWWLERPARKPASDEEGGDV
jgi:hypothetical protein